MGTKEGANENVTKSGWRQALSAILNHRLFIPVILFLIIQLLVIIGLFTRVEMKLYDSWFRLSGARNPEEEVVVIAIDDHSIEQIGPWPQPRSVHAQLLDG